MKTAQTYLFGVILVVSFSLPVLAGGRDVIFGDIYFVVNEEKTNTAKAGDRVFYYIYVKNYSKESKDIRVEFYFFANNEKTDENSFIETVSGNSTIRYFNTFTIGETKGKNVIRVDYYLYQEGNLVDK